MEHAAEQNESLWLLTASPAIWAAHFMVSYITAAVWCARLAGPDASLWTVRVVIAVLTAAAFAGIGTIGWIGFRHHRLGNETVPHDADTAEDRHRFVGFATFLLSSLSAVATLYSFLTIVFIESCH
jgi:hypothetical protein